MNSFLNTFFNVLSISLANFLLAMREKLCKESEMLANRFFSSLWKRGEITNLAVANIHQRHLTQRPDAFLKTKHCPGCGAFFQNHSVEKSGYLPPMLPKLSLSAQEILRIEAIEKSSEPISPQDLKLLLRKRAPASEIICHKCHSNQRSGKKTSITLKTNRIQFSDLKMRDGGIVVCVAYLGCLGAGSDGYSQYYSARFNRLCRPETHSNPFKQRGTLRFNV
jgi:hypothetical protein